MGAIRGILLVIASVILFLCLIQMTFFGVLSQSLTYENVEKQSSVIINDILKENVNFTSKINSLYPEILSHCQNNSDYIFSFEGKTIEILCEKALLGEEIAVGEGFKSWVKGIYYKDYECEFLDCFKKTSLSGFTPFFLVSEKAQVFWITAFRIFLLISLFLAIVVFFLVSKKTNMPIMVGVLLILSSMIFIKLDALLSLFADKTFFKFLGIFFSQAFFVSIRVLIAGVIFLLVGIIMKIFKIGLFISKIISKIKEAKSKPKEKPQKLQPFQQKLSEKPKKSNQKPAEKFKKTAETLEKQGLFWNKIKKGKKK